jgi:hypothetical protein
LISDRTVDNRWREEREGATAGLGGGHGGAAMDDGEKLAGVGQTSATVNHFQIGIHWDEAGTKADSVGYISRAKYVPRRVAMAGGGRWLTGVAS